jgi:NAD(P)-dependent dehydrogenase (short-subunit alcohol dehydrogenase family)
VTINSRPQNYYILPDNIYRGASGIMKTWFITGTSRGFGREWTKAALGRGDKVAATARNTDSIRDLVNEYGDSILPLRLDVTDRDADFAAVKQAHEHFGRLDVIVNNAGYGLFGAIEEVSEAEARAQIETNFFGALWVTQAALPYLREQGSGHILQVSSIGGIAAFASGVGLYHASKWALEGFSDALSQEVSQFGIKVTIIEPGGFNTDWAGSSSVHSKENPLYTSIHGFRPTPANKRGDPKASAKAILQVVDAENPPLRLLLGNFACDCVKELYPKRLATWAEWETVTRAADGI